MVCVKPLISQRMVMVGEKCGMVVLKLLSQAQADGDPILALIRGSAINQDGPSSGLTVPNGQSQQKINFTSTQTSKGETRRD